MSKKTGGGLIFGLIVAAVGLFFLLSNFGLVDFEFRPDRWWPLILIGIGLSVLVSHRFADSGGWFMLALGTIFFCTVNKYLGLHWGNFWKLWPLALIWIGLTILFERKGGGACAFGEQRDESTETRLDEKRVFASLEKRVKTENFSGGEVSVIMGSAEIDLRPSQISGGQAVLALSTVMGSIEIRVPREWRLELDTHNVLGSVENKTETVPGSTQRLTIHASVVMGSIEIMN